MGGRMILAHALWDALQKDLTGYDVHIKYGGMLDWWYRRAVTLFVIAHAVQQGRCGSCLLAVAKNDRQTQLMHYRY